MKRTKLLFLLAAFLLSTMAFGQSGVKVVKGVVISQEDNEPVMLQDFVSR